MVEEKIAQGTYDFRVMREKGYRYVDKTALLYPLVTRDGDGFFFISRPRRFGKSLMLSTLECLFRGERELFKGLAIDADFPGANFSRAIQTLAAASEHKSVVILIDEYDAPVGHALNDIQKASAIRQELSNFYIQIKNNVGAIRFMMMTGVTRFTQLSVFSALNNLTDLTMDSRYATLLGYTDEELEANFSKTLHRHAEVMGLSYEDYREKLRWWYNGYRFARWNTAKVYNPYAIGQTLRACTPEFIGTWISTGWTSAVFHYFANNQLAEQDYENVEDVSYGPKEDSVQEFSFQRILYVLLTSSGFFRVTAEDRQSHGRADLVAETPEHVFVFELKVDGTPQEALAQIKEKGYAEPYRHSGKEVHLIGLSFDGATRTLTGTAAERLIS